MSRLTNFKQKMAEGGFDAAIISSAVNQRSGSSVETSDDGITQKVTTEKGMSLNSSIMSTPIRELAPFRTFNEVRQPKSEFLFRIRDNQFALFEADGGAWQKEAKENIREFFMELLANEIEKGDVVVVS